MCKHKHTHLAMTSATAFRSLALAHSTSATDSASVWNRTISICSQMWGSDSTECYVLPCNRNADQEYHKPAIAVEDQAT